MASHHKPEARVINLNVLKPAHEVVQAPELHNKDNSIRTSQYTIWNFPFLNLYKQFHRAANVYFLLIMFLQMWEEVSITRGEPSMASPLAFVLLVTAIKDALEDYTRHKYDRIENSRPVKVLASIDPASGEMHFATRTWSSLKPGSVVRLKNREMVPADIVLLKCEDEESQVVYVMTAGLDGETNLKQRQVAAEMPKDLRRFDDSCTIKCNQPNKILDSFDGALSHELNQVGVQIPLTANNILLRGSQIRNSAWAIGVVVYSGEDTKIQLNSSSASFKTSSAMGLAQQLMIYIFGVQIILCLCAAIASGIHISSIEEYFYLWSADSKEFAAEMSLRFFNYVIIFTNFIPISLLVTIDMVKFGQSFFISWDLGMFHEPTEQFAKVNCSELNEELGCIEHVFTDKTGTLTANIMKFKACATLLSHFAVEDEANLKLQAKDPLDAAALRQFWLSLALNHSVIPEKLENGEIIFSASSPDEGALVHACKANGVHLHSRGPKSITLTIDPASDMGSNRSFINPAQSHNVEFKVLCVLDFTSNRKRSSVVVELPGTSEIVLYCKGADNVILDRLQRSSRSSDTTRHVFEHLNSFATSGLRTLCLAKRSIPRSEFERWFERFTEASVSLHDRTKRIEDLYGEIEVELELIGCTGIEDKLQEEVPETISALRKAGIKVWMLTGDKVDTAINIGFSCSLWTHKMELLFLLFEDTPYQELTEELVRERLHQLTKQLETNPPPKQLYCFVVDTKAVYALDHFKMMPAFLKVANMCESVICARVSPDQKATIVQGIRDSDRQIKTLCIGDGANDVPMIQSAHVGIGIYGQEGLQAANAADFAIARFKFLHRLLFVHGRWSARRVGVLVCYMFYKNAVLVLPQFFFAFICLASGEPIYLDYPLYQGYNLIYTALPIIAFGMFDKDVSQEWSIATPSLYGAGSLRNGKAEFLSKRIFWQWIGEGFIHATLIVAVCSMLLDKSPGNVTSQDGKTHGIWYYGATIHLCVCTVVTLRLLIINKTISKIMLATYFVSFLLWIATLYIWSETKTFPELLSSSSNAFGIVKMLQDSGMWATFIVTSVAAILPSFVLLSYREIFNPTEADLTRQREHNLCRHGKPGTVHPTTPAN